MDRYARRKLSASDGGQLARGPRAAVVNGDTALQGRGMSERKLPPWTPAQERVGNVVMYRDYDDYQSRTDREIPAVVLDPA